MAIPKAARLMSAVTSVLPTDRGGRVGCASINRSGTKLRNVGSAISELRVTRKEKHFGGTRCEAV